MNKTEQYLIKEAIQPWILETVWIWSCYGHVEKILVGLGWEQDWVLRDHREEERGMTAAGDVERLSVRGYQCHGCTAGLSCELLIYRPWRTATHSAAMKDSGQEVSSPFLPHHYSVSFTALIWSLSVSLFIFFHHFLIWLSFWISPLCNS